MVSNLSKVVLVLVPIVTVVKTRALQDKRDVNVPMLQHLKRAKGLEAKG